MNRYSTLRLASFLVVILFLASNSVNSIAGPIPGRKIGTYTRSADKAVPKTLRYFPKGKATASNPSDPMAGFSTLVKGSSRDVRSGEKLSYSLRLDGSGNVIVVMNGRVNLETRGGGSRLTAIRFSGRGPEVVTSNSFGTTAGTGKLGRFKSRFTVIAISRTPGKLEVRLNVSTGAKAPTGRRFSFFFKS